jgi:3-dehydroquinate dehydratase-2
MAPRAPSILVLHGPNLNLLGVREPEVYGATTLAELDAELVRLGAELGAEVTCRQSNSEGALIDALHGARGRHQGIVINPGAYTHTSVALHDALRAVAVPAVEVHLSNLWAREAFRQGSLTAPACLGVIMGLGTASYHLALRHLIPRAAAELARMSPRSDA